MTVAWYDVELFLDWINYNLWIYVFGLSFPVPLNGRQKMFFACLDET